eukprot:3592322-Pleurochrysis_carterae.AAC.1
MADSDPSWAQTYTFDNGVVDIAEDEDPSNASAKMGVNVINTESAKKFHMNTAAAAAATPPTSEANASSQNGQSGDANTAKKVKASGHGSPSAKAPKSKSFWDMMGDKEPKSDPSGKTDSDAWRKRLAPKMSSTDDVDDAVLDLREAGTEMGEVFLFHNDDVDTADEGKSAVATHITSTGAAGMFMHAQLDAPHSLKRVDGTLLRARRVSRFPTFCAAGVVLPGDVILEVNGMPVTDHIDASTTLRKV